LLREAATATLARTASIALVRTFGAPLTPVTRSRGDHA
jgi:hypothetical protein